MANRSSVTVAALLLICFALGSWQAHASDPELTSDFFVPEGVTVDGAFFTNPTLRFAVPQTGQSNFANVTNVNLVQNPFPALQGLGISAALLQYAAGAVNPPHTHPRGTELLFVLEGTLFVGIVDTNNTLFSQTLYAGDLFVFPKGLVHFQINTDKKSQARAFAEFSSSNAGLVRLPNALFKSKIDNYILAQSFGVSPDAIQQLVDATVV